MSDFRYHNLINLSSVVKMKIGITQIKIRHYMQIRRSIYSVFCLQRVNFIKDMKKAIKKQKVQEFSKCFLMLQKIRKNFMFLIWIKIFLNMNKSINLLLLHLKMYLCAFVENWIEKYIVDGEKIHFLKKNNKNIEENGGNR